MLRQLIRTDIGTTDIGTTSTLCICEMHAAESTHAHT